MRAGTWDSAFPVLPAARHPEGGDHRGSKGGVRPACRGSRPAIAARRAECAGASRLTPAQAQAAIQTAMAKILQPNEIEGSADPATARADALYSLDPQDYQTARRALVDALSGASSA